MKRISIIVFVLMISNVTNSQSVKSTFDNIKGKYFGTVNGILLIKRGDINNKEQTFTILDFQGSKAQLINVHDEDEIYDKYTENYLGYTTSGKSNIRYSTYANANELHININNTIYEASTIDGACDDKIDGIVTTYYAEGENEYLIIKFSKIIELNNYQYLLRKDYEKYGKSKNSKRNMEKDARFARILPDSVLIFYIKGK